MKGCEKSIMKYEKWGKYRKGFSDVKQQ